MPTDIIVSERKFLNPLKNDDSFAANPSDFSTHLKGSAMEKMRSEHKIDVAWFMFASSTDTVRSSLIDNPIGSGDVTRLTRSAGDWTEDGFSDGQTISVVAYNKYGVDPATVVSISVSSVDIILVSPDSLILATNIGSGDGVVYGPDSEWFDGLGSSLTENTFMGICGNDPLFAALFKFGIIENNDSINFQSLIDGTEQSYYAEGLGLGAPRSTAYVDGESSQPVKGWQTGEFKMRFVETYSVPFKFIVRQTGAVLTLFVPYQRFQFRHDFIIVPYIKEDDQDTVENLFESLNSLRYVFEVEMLDTLSNPNTSKIIKDDYKEGSVASYGENYNGFNSKYNVDSISIVDGGGNPITALAVGQTNTVTAVITSVKPSPFQTAEPYVVYHSYLPEASDEDTTNGYTNRVETYEEVWFYESLRSTLDAGSINGTIITNLTAVLNSPNQFTVTFDVTYSAAQRAILTDQKEFVLAIGVGDDALSTDDSDKVIIKILKAQYTKDTDIPGLMDVLLMEFFDYPTDLVSGLGYSNYIGSVEDAEVMNIDFTLNMALGAVMESINLNWIAYNPSTGDSFILTETPIDISSITNVPEGGFTVQEINIDSTRGFNYPSGDQFNFIKFTTSPLSGSNKPYNLQFGIKADWREWLQLVNANTVFYDISEPLNGLSKLIANYMANGYEIRVALDAVISSEGVNTNYIFRSPKLEIYDYDAHDGSLDWTCLIESFRTSNNAPLGGNISSSEDTRMKFTFNSPTITVADVALYWGIIRIEKQNNPSQDIEEFGSQRINVQNILKPLVGETLCKKSIGAGDSLVLECLVDFTKLQSGVNYKPSARFGLNDATATPIGGKLTEAGVLKKTEDDQIKIID